MGVCMHIEQFDASLVFCIFMSKFVKIWMQRGSERGNELESSTEIVTNAHRSIHAKLHAKQTHRWFTRAHTPCFCASQHIEHKFNVPTQGCFRRTIPKSVSTSQFRKKECFWFSS